MKRFPYLLLFTVLYATIGCNLERINPVAPPVSFELKLQGFGGEQAYGGEAIQTADSGFLVAGRTYLSGGTSTDIYLVKLDKKGVQQWAKKLGSGGDDDAFGVRQTSDGGYVAVGSTMGSSSYVIKTDANGSQQWAKTGLGTAASVTITKDGNIVVVGNQLDASNVYTDIFLTKYTPSGSEVWTRKFGSSAISERGIEVAATPDGGVIIGGSISISSNTDFYLLKADINGNETWSQQYGGAGTYEFGKSVALTGDGGYVMVGSSNSGSGPDDMYIVKTNSTGVQQWEQTVGDAQFDSGEGVAVTPSGNIIVTGAVSFGQAPVFYLSQFSASGTQGWIKSFDGGSQTFDDYPSSVAVTLDGGYLICGSTSDGSGSLQIYLVKTDAEGNVD